MFCSLINLCRFMGRALIPALVGVFCFSLVACDGVSSDEVKSTAFENEGVGIEGVVGYWRTKDAKYFEIVILDLFSGDKKVVEFPSIPSDVQVMGDGRLLTAIKKRNEKGWLSELCIFDIDVGRCESGFSNGGYSLFGPDLHEDSVVYYSKENGGLSIKKARLGTGEVDYLDCPDHNCSHPSWSHDGDKIAYIVGDSKVSVYDVLTGKNDVINVVDGEGVLTGVDFSEGKNGEVLVFSFIEGDFSDSMRSKIVSLDLRGGGDKIVLDLNGRVLGISGTNVEGGVIALIGDRMNSQNLFFYNLDDGKRVIVSDPDWIAGPASWSE